MMMMMIDDDNLSVSQNFGPALHWRCSTEIRGCRSTLRSNVYRHCQQAV